MKEQVVKNAIGREMISYFHDKKNFTDDIRDDILNHSVEILKS